MPNSTNSSPRNMDEAAGRLTDIVRNARLVFRLLGDARVPAWQKAIPLGAVLYVLSPIDLIPDMFVGLGQLDDIAILLLGVKLFLDLIPRDIMTEHRVAMASAEGAPDEPAPDSYVDTTYRVLDEDEKR